MHAALSGMYQYMLAHAGRGGYTERMLQQGMRLCVPHTLLFAGGAYQHMRL